MSRKVSVRIPQPLWEWLIATAGNRLVSSKVVDCLAQVRSGQPPSRPRFWAWGIIAIVVGLATVCVLNRLRTRPQKKLSAQLGE